MRACVRACVRAYVRVYIDVYTFFVKCCSNKHNIPNLHASRFCFYKG